MVTNNNIKKRDKLFRSEKKTPFSVSIKPSLKDEFQLACYNSGTTPSREVQLFIESFVRKYKTKNGNK